MTVMRAPGSSRWIAFLVPAAMAASGCADGALAPDAIGRVRAPGAPVIEDAEIGVSAQPPTRRAPTEHEDDDASAVLLFHDVLAPYGAWRDDPRLGLVWSPSEAVGAAFVPYATHGRWTYREVAAQGGDAAEWTWVSDLPWGWVTFHYGRWAYAGDQGWAWIPGRKYGASWVDWRVPDPRRARDAGANVVGWGPRPPAFLWRVVSFRRSVSARFDPRDGFLEAVPYAAFATPYVYAPATRVFAPDLGAALLPAADALAIAHATTPAGAPRAGALGLSSTDAPSPPAMDRGLQQAWMLATPGSSAAVGSGPLLPSAPRLRTWVAGR